MTPAIDSAANPRIKRLKKLFTDAGFRKAEGLWVVEGIRQAEEAVKAYCPTPGLVECFFVGGETSERGEALKAALVHKGVEVVTVGRGVFRSFSDTATPQGVCLVVEAPVWDPQFMNHSGGPLLVADQIREPGNLGTLFRTAAAAGAGGLLLTRGTVDPGNPKCVRASAGTIFHLPFIQLESPEEARGILTRPIYATSGAGGVPPEELPLDKPFALVLGGEAEGLGARWEGLVDSLITIPMGKGVESLNVAAAGAAILFEAARQRRKTGSPDRPAVLL